ncbi:hypothetical protein D7X99_42165, partial [Corallococcus sp. AB032C]
MRAHSGFSTCFAMPGSVRREPLPRQSLTAHRWPDGYGAGRAAEHVAVVGIPSTTERAVASRAGETLAGAGGERPRCDG